MLLVHRQTTGEGDTHVSVAPGGEQKQQSSSEQFKPGGGAKWLIIAYGMQ